MHLSEEQILALAPDEASKKSGKDLAVPGKWLRPGRSDGALWGECPGSGSKPYQTVIDTGNIAFKCSCPSRKFPCKHGLGLALLYSRQQQLFAEGAAPAWVSEWIARRAETAEKKAAPKEAVTDAAAQAKRRLAREQKVLDGTAELRLWLKDLVRQGLVQAPEKGASFWESMARRLVDAQAPALAGLVRDLGATPFYKENWQPVFLRKLAQAYLAATGYAQLPQLPPELQAELRNVIGFPHDQDALREETGITDTWLVLARQTTQEEGLTTERNWLYGTGTGRSALVLQFFVRGQASGSLSLAAGTCVEAELVYFPSAVPLRALVKKHISVRGTAPQVTLPHWMAVAEQAAAVAERTPFATARPFVVESLTPVLQADAWWLLDAEGRAVPVADTFSNTWQLLALSGGAPVRMAVLGNDHRYEPLGLWQQQTYLPL